MRTYYIIVVTIILGVFALLLFPTLHLIVGAVDTTGFLPLTSAGTVLLPYAFLGIGVYIFIKLTGRHG